MNKVYYNIIFEHCVFPNIYLLIYHVQFWSKPVTSFRFLDVIDVPTCASMYR